MIGIVRGERRSVLWGGSTPGPGPPGGRAGARRPTGAEEATVATQGWDPSRRRGGWGVDQPT
jgi:hypothetical protein